MSVATEFAPSVSIPARARTAASPAAPAAPVELVPSRRLASVTVLRPPVRHEAVAPLRLTRRGVVVLAVAVALLGLGLIGLARLSAPPAASSPASPRVVTVQSGDTLWSIATRVAPNVDPRAEVARLQRRNHLSAVDLVPGQTLRVP